MCVPSEPIQVEKPDRFKGSTPVVFIDQEGVTVQL